MTSDRPVASDLSYEVLQARRLRSELSAKVADDRCLPLHLLPQRALQARRWVADPDMGQPEWPVHVHIRKG
jgi:hypothetical protein